MKKLLVMLGILTALALPMKAQVPGIPGITNILGGIDESATNIFSPQELELRLGGVYSQKDGAAAILVAGEYWGIFKKAPNFGIGAELISLSSDTAAAFPYVGYRKTFGNVAGVLFAGGGYDFDHETGMGVVGLRVERWSSRHLGIFASVSYEIQFENNSKENDRGLIAGGGICYKF